MNSNPILEEIWLTKNELAHEAGYDIHRLCENTRRWAAEHPHSGPVVRDAEELRKFIAEQERKRTETASLTLNDQDPPKS